MTSDHSPFLFTEPANIKGKRITFGGTDAHHLFSVRRAVAGDTIAVSDGEGRIFEARIVSIDRTQVVAESYAERSRPPWVPSITVFQGLAKGSKVDFVVQKLVEIGVDEIVMFFAGRSVPKWEAARAKKAEDRWISIGREASKQSRRAHLPHVAGPVTFAEMLDLLHQFDLAYTAHESARTRLTQALPESPPERLALVVGPEGGLEPGEVDQLCRASVPFSLGPQILRTETAGIVAATVVASHFGLIG